MSIEYSVTAIRGGPGRGNLESSLAEGGIGVGGGRKPPL